jgi:hypothetical protein
MQLQVQIICPQSRRVLSYSPKPQSWISILVSSGSSYGTEANSNLKSGRGNSNNGDILDPNVESVGSSPATAFVEAVLALTKEMSSVNLNR